MNLNAPSLTFVCGSTIYPSRFVMVSTAADYTALQATDGSSNHGDEIIGISQEHGRLPPVSGAGTYAGAATDIISVYGVQEVCLLELGSTVTRGDLLKANSDGKGIKATAGSDNYGAVCLQSGVSGDKVRVNVLIGTIV